MDEDEKRFWHRLDLWGNLFITVLSMGVLGTLDGKYIPGGILTLVGFVGIVYVSQREKGAVGTIRYVAIAIIGFCVVLMAIVAVVRQLPSVPPSRPIPGIASSMAVLPLENFSGDPNQEYFADGMTDELITELANIGGLTVISRTSVMQYKGQHKAPLPEIARELNVSKVLEGSVMRIGDTVRITVQLIDAATDKHIWAKSYESESKDVLKLQATLGIGNRAADQG